MQECAKRGLLVMLDMHRLVAANDIPELWYAEGGRLRRVLRLVLGILQHPNALSSHISRPHQQASAAHDTEAGYLKGFPVASCLQV